MGRGAARIQTCTHIGSWLMQSYCTRSQLPPFLGCLLCNRWSARHCRPKVELKQLRSLLLGSAHTYSPLQVALAACTGWALSLVAGIVPVTPTSWIKGPASFSASASDGSFLGGIREGCSTQSPCCPSRGHRWSSGFPAAA